MGIVLGLSFGYHNSAAALVKDGELVVAASEERFTRIKNDSSFPVNAIKFCLSMAKISVPEKIVFYEDPYLKFNRQIAFALKEKSYEYMDQITSKIKLGEIDPLKKISDFFNIGYTDIDFCTHHLSHAASAFFPSNYNHAAVLTIDGVGEYETLTIYKADIFKGLKKLFSLTLPFSIGLLYSAFTSFLGFEVNEGEYKVMGMAPYGKPKYKDKILQLIKIDFEKDIYEVDENVFEFKVPVKSHLKQKFYDIFGDPRNFSEKFFISKSNKGRKNRYYADIAASIQSVTEDLMINFARKALKLCNEKILCMAGGVALNSVANGKIHNFLNLKGFYVQPAAGDAGGAVGAAFLGAYKIGDISPKRNVMRYDLGKSYRKKEIEKAIFDFMIFDDEKEFFKSKKEFLERVLQHLLENKVIGWFEGRFEFGPRALGRRSIIANPENPQIKEIVNQKIKYRELFRPFAPSVLEEHANEWFEMPKNIDENSPGYFMLSVVKVKKNKSKKIPAVVHVDKTARIHLVKKDNSLYRKLIEKFYEKTGVPLILNTSFNLKGEPIVNSPDDAFRTFIQSEIELLAIYPYIIYKGLNR